MNIGILGGTFDPIHIGHLGIATAASTQVGLDKILFIPAGHPRFKRAKPSASVVHRLKMVHLATNDIQGFEVCDIETSRPGPSYSVDTLVEIKANLPEQVNLFFIVGMDVLNQLHRWKDPERVRSLCQLLVLNRSGEQNFNWDEFYQRVPAAKRRIRNISSPIINVSATELRNKLATGKSISGLVPDVVAKYIFDQKLYLTIGEGRTTN